MSQETTVVEEDAMVFQESVCNTLKNIIWETTGVRIFKTQEEKPLCVMSIGDDSMVNTKNLIKARIIPRTGVSEEMADNLTNDISFRAIYRLITGRDFIEV